jgi:hypothetical protein
MHGAILEMFIAQTLMTQLLEQYLVLSKEYDGKVLDAHFVRCSATSSIGRELSACRTEA